MIHNARGNGCGVSQTLLILGIAYVNACDIVPSSTYSVSASRFLLGVLGTANSVRQSVAKQKRTGPGENAKPVTEGTTCPEGAQSPRLVPFSFVFYFTCSYILHQPSTVLPLTKRSL